jgi:hypothetical protein
MDRRRIAIIAFFLGLLLVIVSFLFLFLPLGML